MLNTDWDWTIGTLVQIFVFGLWTFNIILGFMTLAPYFAGVAVIMCFWFLMAPWCISEYSQFLSIGDMRHLSSIYGKVRHDLAIKKYS